jgi:hypothetical protein
MLQVSPCVHLYTKSYKKHLYGQTDVSKPEQKGIHFDLHIEQGQSPSCLSAIHPTEKTQKQAIGKRTFKKTNRKLVEHVKPSQGRGGPAQVKKCTSGQKIGPFRGY